MQSTSEKKNPRGGAGVLSIMFIWWMQDVLRLGSKRPLTDKDLFPLLDDYKAEMLIEKAEKYWLDELKRSQLENKKPRLWKALIRLIPWTSGLAIIILKTLWSLSFVFLPFCLWLILKTLNDGPNMDTKLAFSYVAILGMTSVVKAVSTQHYDYITELWALKLKVAVIGLVYKKVLSLNRYGLETKLSGNIINLVSNDAQKGEKSLNQLGMVLAVPFELTVSLVILWYVIGWEAFTGAAFFFILATFQIVMARTAAKLRGKTAVFTDKRLAVMNEVVSGIRAVKMYAWEWNFRDILYELRRNEMAIIRFKGIIISTIVVLYHATPPIAALISVTTLAFTGSRLSSFEIFALLLGLMTLRFIFCVNLSTSLYVVTDAKVALDRIQAFLKDKVSISQGTVEHHENSQLLTEQQGNLDDSLAVQYKCTKKTVDYRKQDNSAGETSLTFISNSVPAIRNETVSSKVPLDHVTSALETCTNNKTTAPFLSISDASCSWTEGHNCDTLCGITLNIGKGEMLAVTGSVGCGKSSLLTAILGELPLRKGAVSHHGKVAYVPQIPWVFSGTVRENILFGLPFNEERFQHVVQVCGLTKDLNDFTNGDLTEIGQRGVTLSGGQKARVGLARAVYSEADIYLLDDPLSAVDTKVGSKLFEDCIIGELSGRIRLLATHQLQYLKNVDRIAVMEKGSIIYQGGYEELKDKGAVLGLLELSEPLEDEPGSIESVNLEQNYYIEELLHRSSVPSPPSETGHADHGDKGSLSNGLESKKNSVVCQEGCQEPKERRSPHCTSINEVSEEGNIKKVLDKPTNSPVLSGKEHGLLDDLELPELLSPENVELLPKSMLQPDERPVFDLKESEEHESPQRTIIHEANEEESIENLLDLKPSNSPVMSGKEHGLLDDLELPELQVFPESVVLIPKSMQEPDERPVRDLKESDEQKSTGTVTWRLYWKYFKEGLSVPLIISTVFLLILAQVFLLAPNWWLAEMAEMSSDDQKAPITQVIHACLVSLCIVVMAASSFFFYYLLLEAAENLHNKMTTAIIKAPVLFFDTNPAGRILNRFSKDVGCMDDVLPQIFLTALLLCLSSLCAILVPAATNYWLFLALLPIIGIYIYFGRYFLKSSRELKRIEAMRCSPVYSHVTETVNGLEIVHSSNMNRTFLDRLQRYQDENTQAFFMVVSCNRWLAVRLDLLSSAFVTIVAVGAVLITESPALAGLALTYALQTLDATQYGVRLASEVENWMTSIERVITYTEIEPEAGYSTEACISESWPDEGSLAVQDLSLVYFEGGPRVLKDISFSVCSKEKVGVVGRTGAGKSSLVSALFRMPEPLGKLLIDGVDITSINLQEARRSMAVITQDPVLFGGSLKRNMDPFSQFTDQRLWTALEEVQLKTVVQDLPGQLNFEIRESGRNLSVGERQLVCLARALVQRSKIIVLDEATANVDFKTDRLIQEVIRVKFKDSTVLTIAHRLNTIMDYDKVLVLDGGRVVEFDKPDVLIRSGGMFAELVKSHDNSVKH